MENRLGNTEIRLVPDAGSPCVIDYPILVSKGFSNLVTDCEFRTGAQLVVFYSDVKSADVKTLTNASGVKAMADAAAAAGDTAENEVTEVPAMPVDPASAIEDVQKVMAQAGGANAYAVMLALIAVAGGGAGWKFYQSFAKQRHEQKMKALEIEQSKGDHKECEAKRLALAEKVNEITSKLDNLESKLSVSRTASENLEDLEGRVEALEVRKRKTTRKPKQS